MNLAGCCVAVPHWSCWQGWPSDLGCRCFALLMEPDVAGPRAVRLVTLEREAAQRAVAVVGERVAGADGDRAGDAAADRVPRAAEGGGLRVHAAAAGRLPQAAGSSNRAA